MQRKPPIEEEGLFSLVDIEARLLIKKKQTFKMNPFEIMSIPGKGRAMISQKSFSVGDIIFEEEAFVSCQFSWNVAYGYLACDHCMRPLETTEQNVRRLASDQSLSVPFQEHDPTKQWLDHFCVCVQCGVKYCSEDCRVDALKKYHKVACMGNFRQDDSHPINILNDTWKKMHYPPETGTILLIVRIMAMYKQSKDKAAFLETLKSFQSVFVNVEDQIVHKMLGANFESQMLELYKRFCNAFTDEEFSIFTTPDAFKSLMALIGTNSQGIATSSFAEWVKKVSDLTIPEEEKNKLESCIDDLYNKVGECK
ncbi:SMYD5 family protein [Megaselia abdita]